MRQIPAQLFPLSAAFVALGVLALGQTPEASRATRVARQDASVAADRSAANPELMPVEEIRAGMVGTGRTVFQGAELEDFQVHILGVLRHVMGPRRNLILARLEGGPLAETGVIAGMSGSPVYVDGRLIGAVSYSLGAFSKEPIAGITPIAEMMESVALPGARPATSPARLELPVTREGLAASLRAAFTRARPFAGRADDLEVLGLSFTAGAQLGAMLRPIATPLVIGGFSPDLTDIVAGSFRDLGFAPTVTSATRDAPTPNSDRPLRPGDAVGVSLVTGDLELAATGTVTHIDGDRVYAFGHPFYNLGPTQFPMTTAHVFTVLPSLSSSVKIVGVGDVVGTFQQDRATAIAGTLGDGPPLIPLHISLDSDRGLSKSFDFEVVDDQLFTPLLTYLSILNTLRSYEREFGAATFAVKGTTRVKDYGDIAFEDVFAGDSPSVGAATYVAAPITFLLSNHFAPVEIEAVDITISSTEQPRTATLERVWLDNVRPRAGDTVDLKILTRTYRGEETTRTVPIAIPSNASGTLSILVSDGTRLTRWERQQLRTPGEPRSLEQMIRALNNAHRNNTLYVRLLNSDAGAVVNGETLGSLPPSILSVFESDRSGGSFIPLRKATIGDWELPTDYAVSGSRLLTISLNQ